MKSKNLSRAALVVLASATYAGIANARDQIRIVGSSTVFPFTQAVAEQFANMSGNPAPVVEATGTGGGIKIFCDGVGENKVDITGASRPMKESELNSCRASGVESITEVQIGFDGIAFAHAKGGQEFSVTKQTLFLALAAEIPVDGEIIANPHTNWSQIDSIMPDTAIQVFGPPPTSGTRDAWVELVMEAGCEAFDEIQALDDDRRREVCGRMRQDGPFIEAGENDNLIVRRLGADPSAYGIFGFSFLYENLDTLKGIQINGVAPTITTLANGSYPVSRPLFFYIKNAHRGVIPGLEEFITEYVSEDAIGDDGYLTERGLIPLSSETRQAIRDTAENSRMNLGFGS